jgi:CHASE2 domain-containing sensor protein
MDNKSQIKKWQTAATVAAFTALGLIVFGYWIGTETVLKCVMVLICSVMFSVGVLWWYWALNQISLFSEYMNSLQKVIKELKEDLQDIKKDI